MENGERYEAAPTLRVERLRERREGTRALRERPKTSARDQETRIFFIHPNPLHSLQTNWPAKEEQRVKHDFCDPPPPSFTARARPFLAVALSTKKIRFSFLLREISTLSVPSSSSIHHCCCRLKNSSHSTRILTPP